MFYKKKIILSAFAVLVGSVLLFFYFIYFFVLSGLFGDKNHSTLFFSILSGFAILIFLGIIYLTLYPLFCRFILPFIYKQKWWFWDFSGLRLISEKIFPLTEKRKRSDSPPSSFFLWFVGIYVASFQISTQIYENRVEKVWNRTNIIFSQLALNSPEAQKLALEQIPIIQNQKIPITPIFWNPFSIFLSMVGYKDKVSKVTKELQMPIESRKSKLADISPILSNIDLTNADLEKANFKGVKLNHANFSFANLKEAEFNNAKLLYANFSFAKLGKAKFNNAKLLHANFSNSNLVETDFSKADFDYSSSYNLSTQGANFSNSNLRNAIIKETDLEDVDFRGANLSGADLTNSRLYGASFFAADLCASDLTGIDLKKADLRWADLGIDPPKDTVGSILKAMIVPRDYSKYKGAKLANIRDWTKSCKIEKANIYGIEGAPEGFREWALENGAVYFEYGTYQHSEWKKNRKEKLMNIFKTMW